MGLTFRGYKQVSGRKQFVSIYCVAKVEFKQKNIKIENDTTNL
jgi:hypothetical protein